MAIINEMAKTITINGRVIPIVDIVPNGCEKTNTFEGIIFGFSFWINYRTEYICALDERDVEPKKALGVKLRNEAQLLHQGKIILDEKTKKFYDDVRKMYIDFLKENHLNGLVSEKRTKVIGRLCISEVEDIYTGRTSMPTLKFAHRIANDNPFGKQIANERFGLGSVLEVECCDDDFMAILSFVLENFEPYAGEERYYERERVLGDEISEEAVPEKPVKKRRKKGDGYER